MTIQRVWITTIGDNASSAIIDRGKRRVTLPNSSASAPTRPLRSAKAHWGAEMKELVAAIALLCVSSTVLAHDIYSNLRDRDGHLCCNGQDCRPVDATVLPNGNYYLPSTEEIIPADMAS